MISLYEYGIWIVTFLISLLIEYFIQPSTPKFNRLYSSYLLHFCIISLFYLIVVAIVQRTVFAGLFVLITQVIFVVVSNAKYKALQEPLVFSDIVMFSQAFKYPRLYFPFLSWLAIIAVPTLIISAIVLVIYFETAITMYYPLLGLLIVVVFVGLYTTALQQTPSLQITHDIQQLGFLASLVSYGILSRQRQHKKHIETVLKNSSLSLDTQQTINKKNDLQHVQDKQSMQDIIVIQSESFFDARRLHPIVADHVLEHFDQCCAESYHYGRLQVSAWGANTMRTEFSFLSGIDFEEMGYYRFYPYHYMRYYRVHTLASYLQKMGYYCVCIHPHHAAFFGRASLFPRWGFDEFIDIDAFSKNDKYGPYISDDAVGKKIIATLRRKNINKPCFIFAITMENHGPLHLEKINSEEAQKYYTDQHELPHHTNELSIYLRHLKHANTMLGSLMATLKTENINKRSTLLCLYGDHVPSMPEIYAETGFTDNRTDYVIWSSQYYKNHEKNHDNNQYNQEDMSVQHLAERILHHIQP